MTQWLDVAIPAADDVTPEPTAASRLFAVLFTGMYEAWAAYDGHAAGVATGAMLKNTGGAPTILNKREAISHAAYSILVALAPGRKRFAMEFMSA